jgi:hypothetical protein
MSDLVPTGDAAVSEAVDSAPRKTPMIEPDHVLPQSDGFAWAEYLVRLPREATLQDLNDPGLWRKVQSGRQPLRRLDKLRIVSYAEDWLVECTVAGAMQNGVSLSKPVKTDLPARTEQLFEDALYRVTWVGIGYQVIRKRDGAPVSMPTMSKAMAERDLKNQYPINVG